MIGIVILVGRPGNKPWWSSAPEPGRRFEAFAAAPQDTPADGLATIETILAAADPVICPTGCMGHGDYWRVQNHCRKTGKTCVLMEQPDALRIVRIHVP